MAKKQAADTAIALEWLTVIKQWLNHFEKSHLSEQARQLNQQIQEALAIKDYTRVSELIESLEMLSQQSGYSPQESAEILFRCGYAAAMAKDIKKALDWLHRAEQKYTPHPHNHFVVSWAVGCLQWLIPEKQNEAMNSWTRSIQELDGILASHRTNSDMADWYQRRRNLMRAALKKSVDNNYFRITPIPEDVDALESTPSEYFVYTMEAAPQEEQPASEPATDAKEHHFLRTFRVFNEIPAGGFEAVGVDRQVTGHVDIRQVYIQNRPFRIINLHGDNVYQLAMPEHAVVKVKGDSMNKAGIDDGDFVLLHIQEIATNRDIVAAEYIDEDVKATLKRFFSSPEGVILEPESENEAHQKIVIANFDEGFYVRGIALAVFKPES